MKNNLTPDYPLNYKPLMKLLEEKYGERFQRMSKREKVYLIYAIARHLHCFIPGEIRNEIFLLGEKISDEMSKPDQESLLDSLIAQVRWGENAKFVHNTSTIHGV